MYEYWKFVTDYPFVIGDFVWTGMDHLGEAGLGHNRYTKKPDTTFVFGQTWPWFNSFCGDIDLIGFKKPQSYYRDVLWDRSKVAMHVLKPVKGMVDNTSFWGWPDEHRTWNWYGNEGDSVVVNVYSKSDSVALYCNDSLVGNATKVNRDGITYRFSVPYHPGELKAKVFSQNEVKDSISLKTTKNTYRVQLDKSEFITSSSSDSLLYIDLSVLDSDKELVNDAIVPIKLSYEGVGEVAAIGNANPTDMSSFNSYSFNSYKGRALVILRGNNKKGLGKLNIIFENNKLQYRIKYN